MGGKEYLLKGHWQAWQGEGTVTIVLKKSFLGPRRPALFISFRDKKNHMC